MSNRINQATASIVEYSIAELSTMVTALNGEQDPINPKKVEAIRESFIDGLPLLQLPEVTLFEGTPIYTGGRHRLAALQEEYADDLGRMVQCLQYVAEDANDVVLRITSSNGSRNMNKAVVNKLNVAAKYGFDIVSSYDLLLKMHNSPESERLNLFTTALALSINAIDISGVTVTDGTGLSVAKALVTQLKKVSNTVELPAKFDSDGVQLCSSSKAKVFPFLDMLSGKVDDIVNFKEGTYSDEGLQEIAESLDCAVELIEATLLADLMDTLITNIVNEIRCMHSNVSTLPASIYSVGRIKGAICNEGTELTVSTRLMYQVIVGIPTDWQRKAPAWAAVFATRLTELLK